MFGFQPSKHGLFVIDVDEGYGVLKYAIADGVLPEPMTVRKTGSGGYHVFYRITKEEVAKLASANGKYEFTHYDTNRIRRISVHELRCGTSCGNHR